MQVKQEIGDYTIELNTNERSHDELRFSTYVNGEKQDFALKLRKSPYWLRGVSLGSDHRQFKELAELLNKFKKLIE